MVTTFVDTTGRLAGMPPERRSLLRLAVEELVMNVINHGYGAAAADSEVLIEAERVGCSVHVRISDTAPFFDPVKAPLSVSSDVDLRTRAPGGLGLFLIRQAVDLMCHTYALDGNRTTIVMHSIGKDGC